MRSKYLISAFLVTFAALSNFAVFAQTPNHSDNDTVTSVGKQEITNQTNVCRSFPYC